MRCVILQPSYIPWRGYFHQIRKADVFVFYDDVQYDRRGWRNRNRIKTPHGVRWLTIPVKAKGTRDDGTPLREIRISPGTDWAGDHLKTLRFSYGKAPHFARYAPLLEEVFARPPDLLADFTIGLTRALSAELGIVKTRFLRSSELESAGAKTDRLLSILRQLGATRYLSGPSARDYLEEAKFREAGIEVEYMTYDYPEYEQLYPPYEPEVSVLDLLFMKGPDAPRYIWDGP